MLAILALIVAILGIEARLRSAREAELYELDLRKNQHVLGRTLAAVCARVWRKDGLAAAKELLERTDVGDDEIAVRLVDLTHGSIDGPRKALPPELLGRLRHGEEVVQLAAYSHPPTLHTWVPLDADGRRNAALELSTALRGKEEYLRRATVRFLAVAAGMAFAGAIAAAALGARMVGQPVSALVQQARRIGEGHFEQSSAPRPHDELGELGSALDAMAIRLEDARQQVESETRARLHATEQLRHADRLAAVGTLAAGLAHELGTPLHVVLGRAKHARRMSQNEGVCHDLDIVAEECRRMTRIVQELLTFARSSSSTERVRQRIGDVVHRAVTLVEPLIRTRGLQLDVTGPSEVFVDVGRDKIEQVLTNLFINAVHAMSNGGAIIVRWQGGHPHAPAGGEEGSPCSSWVCLTVEDEGTGIAPEILDRVLDPFFTTKDVGQGVGLGLSVAHGIVRDHGGVLAVHNRATQPGACFEVWLPEVNGDGDSPHRG